VNTALPSNDAFDEVTAQLDAKIKAIIEDLKP
jgi:hypothetical protein